MLVFQQCYQGFQAFSKNLDNKNFNIYLEWVTA